METGTGRMTTTVRHPPVELPRCQHCGCIIARVEEGALKFSVRSRLVAVRLNDGVAEMNCPHCGEATDLPLTHRWWRSK